MKPRLTVLRSDDVPSSSHHRVDFYEESPRVRSIICSDRLLRIETPWTVIAHYKPLTPVGLHYVLAFYRNGPLVESEGLNGQLIAAPLPHVQPNGMVCMGTALDSIQKGMHPVQAFWNSDFNEEGRTDAWDEFLNNGTWTYWNPVTLGCALFLRTSTGVDIENVTWLTGEREAA